MSFTHPYGVYNAQASFSKWFEDNIGLSLPSWMSTAAIYFDFPDLPPTYPCFSLTYSQHRDFPIAGGDIVDAAGGTQYHGRKVIMLVDVTCWVTRDRNPNWKRDIVQMRDMVFKLLRSTGSISMKDYLANSDSPTATGTILRIENIQSVEFVQFREEVNPNIERVIERVTLWWIERW